MVLKFVQVLQIQIFPCRIKVVKPFFEYLRLSSVVNSKLNTAFIASWHSLAISELASLLGNALSLKIGTSPKGENGDRK